MNIQIHNIEQELRNKRNLVPLAFKQCKYKIPKLNSNKFLTKIAEQKYYQVIYSGKIILK